MGLTKRGLSRTLSVMLVVMAPARLLAVHVYTPISAAYKYRKNVFKGTESPDGLSYG
jgi:hypothetical protein